MLLLLSKSSINKQMKKLIMKTGLALVVYLITAATTLFAQTNLTKMEIEPPQAAPGFTMKDVNGNIINLTDYKGRKVLLTFYRNVGCPICNLSFHELEEQSNYFKTKNVVLLSVYESTVTNMKKYTDGEKFYSLMIPNPDLELYNLYAIERNTGKLMKGMFHGAMSKMSKGKALFKSKISQDGNKNRIGASFIINEEGKIIKAYYGKYVGDQMPIREIREILN